MESISTPNEILVVVDSDDDSTAEPVKKLAEAWPNLRLVINEFGPGPANAIRFGLAISNSPIAVVTMSDGCDDPRQIDDLVRLIRRGVVVAAASRYMPGGQQVGGPLIKRLLSRTAGMMLFYFAGVGTRDATNSFKAYDRDFLNLANPQSKFGFELGIELTAKARRMRLPIAEIPTTWIDRSYGQSRFKIWEWLPKYLKWFIFAFGIKLKKDKN
jgi:glycosyltransferase involved in cell wall biosynthesis